MSQNKKTIIDEENGQKGFTILEVIVSIAILTIGILAVARMQTVALRGTTLAKRLSVDTIGVQDIIERVVNIPYEDCDDAIRVQDHFPFLPSGTTIEDRTVDGEAGLNDEGNGNADIFVDNQIDHYTLSMNIVEYPDTYTHPTDSFLTELRRNTKTIRVIVESNAPGGSKSAPYDFRKARLTP